MRFSAALSLCAAPLALAGTLQADLVERGAVGVEVATEGKSGSNVAISQSSTQVTEVIVIWVNDGGNSATSTVNSMQALGTASAAAATHTVSS